MRSILTSPATANQKRRQVSLITLFLLIFGTELIAGIVALSGPVSNPPDAIGYALVASLILGISRAWELVGDIDTGLLASIVALTGHGQQLPSDPSATGSDAVVTESEVSQDP
jgi:hypothetical protein